MFNHKGLFGSIRTKILLLAAVALIVVSALLTLVSVFYIRSGTVDALRRSMTESAQIAAERVHDYINLRKELVSSVANRVGALYAEDITLPYEQADIKGLEKHMTDIALNYGFERVFIIDADGMTRTSQHSNMAELQAPYYTAIADENQTLFMSGVTMDNVTNQYVINISVPIHSEDGSRMIGIMVCKANIGFLSEMMGSIHVGEHGSTFVMNAAGECIAHDDPAMLFGGERFMEIKDNPEYASLNMLWDAMRDNADGFMTYDYHGIRFAAYATVPETNNWVIAITADENEFMKDANAATTISVAIAIAVMLASFLICAAIVGRIIRRIERITERIERLSNGDLSEDVQPDDRRDEVSRLTNATHRLIVNLHAMIDSISDVLSDMAGGNLSAAPKGAYPGDFAQLRDAVTLNMEKLSDVVRHISRTAEEVSRGSAQIADGATNLAQGAAEQAGSVEELHSTVSELTERAREIADPERRYLDEQSDDRSEEVEEARVAAAPTLVDKLTAAMALTGERLDEIRRISSGIERISSDTGMLALNAAVEASHAGDYGKGFAVIAAEISELSEKSRQEAKNTDAQLDRILRSIERENKIVSFTVDSVRSISTSLSQVESALAQISSVIEGTAATAEESAAGSEELSAQAEVLRELASGFTVREDDVPSKE